MGNQCCQQQKITTYSLDVSSKLRQQDFLQVQFPKDDRFLAQKIKLFKQLDTPNVLKHINMDKYYWGSWEQGAPIGEGFLYFPQNYFYHGKFNLKPNVYGQIQFIKTGIKYKGQIRQGRADGQGILEHQHDIYFYKGLWKNSQPVTGTLIIRQQINSDRKTEVMFNQFPMGDTKIRYADGRQYVGKIHHKKLVPQGRGKVIYPDGSSYQGQWSDGQFYGQGTHLWPDGSSYEGSYQYGKKHGFGKYVYPSRKIYQGEWIQGLQHGRGSLFNQKGDVAKKGIWRQGRYFTSQQI